MKAMRTLTSADNVSKQNYHLGRQRMERRTIEEVQKYINKELFPNGRIKQKEDIYHFHRDCKYYSGCKEEAIKEGKHKYIKFTCPALERPQKYYTNDLHTIKFSCLKFEPYQKNLFD
jgi:predicted esterase YcpF (UPF0227 family)